jgi:hypothetical protein
MKHEITSKKEPELPEYGAPGFYRRNTDVAQYTSTRYLILASQAFAYAGVGGFRTDTIVGKVALNLETMVVVPLTQQLLSSLHWAPEGDSITITQE